MEKNNIFKIIFSFTFIILACLYLFFDWFYNRINSTFIALLLIGFLPWLTKYIKSLEAFGVKTELVSDDKKEEINDKINDIVINSYTIQDDSNKEITENNNFVEENSLLSIYDTNDSIEKLVLLRVLIEKKLKKICKKNCIECRKFSIPRYVETLRSKEIIKHNVANVILDLLPILNAAVHSDIDNYKISDIEWIISTGISIVNHLNDILNGYESEWNYDNN